MNKFDLSKLSSGKFILTLACSIVFVFASWKKIVEPQAICSILAMVFTFYFTKNNNTPTNGTQIGGTV